MLHLLLVRLRPSSATDQCLKGNDKPIHAVKITILNYSATDTTIHWTSVFLLNLLAFNASKFILIHTMELVSLWYYHCTHSQLSYGTLH
jgi:hypothetical protein